MKKKQAKQKMLFNSIIFCFVTINFAFCCFSCSKENKVNIKTENKLPESPIREGYIVEARTPLILFLDDNGNFSTNKPDFYPSYDAFPLAINIPAIEPMGSYAILAVNRRGLQNLNVDRYLASELNKTSAETRVLISKIDDSDKEFNSRSVANSWRYKEKAIFHLYTNSFFETEIKRNPQSIIICANKEGSSLYTNLGDNTLAVYPQNHNSWMIQERSEENEKVYTNYSKFLPESQVLQEINRNDFEKDVQPKQLNSANEYIQKAASAIVGDLLIETHELDGSVVSYLRGEQANAKQAYAQVFDDTWNGSGAIVASDDWQIAIYGKPIQAEETEQTKQELFILSVNPPVEDAEIKKAVLVNGLLIISWEQNYFPNIGYSGLLILKPTL